MENWRLSKLQAAYQPFHSTETTLLRVRNDILHSIDNGQEVILVLLDLSAIFDAFITFDIIDLD